MTEEAITEPLGLRSHYGLDGTVRVELVNAAMVPQAYIVYTPEQAEQVAAALIAHADFARAVIYVD